jgi:hypothetical protein
MEATLLAALEKHNEFVNTLTRHAQAAFVLGDRDGCLTFLRIARDLTRINFECSSADAASELSLRLRARYIRMVAKVEEVEANKTAPLDLSDLARQGLVHDLSFEGADEVRATFELAVSAAGLSRTLRGEGGNE